MNQKICWIALAIASSIAFSGLVSAQSAPPPKKAESSRAELVVKKLSIVRSQIERVSNKIADVDDQVEKNIETLRKQSVSDIGYEDVFRMLQIQKVELRIELQGLGARAKLLQEKVASTPDAEDEIVKTQREVLRRYVANQKKVLSTIKKLAIKRAVPEVESTEAENQLAVAELRLKEFNAKSKQTSPKYVEAFFETTLAVAERKAKLEAVELLLEKHIESRTLVIMLNDLAETRASEIARMRELTKDYDRWYLEKAEADF